MLESGEQMMGDISARIQLLLIQMIPFLMAIVFHEVGHAFVAKRHGDTTAKDLGRLTLNPIPHLDPLGTIVFPAINMLTGIPFMFGWAKPVPINYNRLKPYRRGLFMVSLAGPATNFILALIAAGIYEVFKMVATPSFYLYEPLKKMSEMAIFINLALAVFNLIPLPPLDGSKMVESFLSLENTRKLERLQAYSIFILIALFWSGALNYVLGGPVEFLANLFINGWRILFWKLGLPLSMDY